MQLPHERVLDDVLWAAMTAAEVQKQSDDEIWDAGDAVGGVGDIVECNDRSCVAQICQRVASVTHGERPLISARSLETGRQSQEETNLWGIAEAPRPDLHKVACEAYRRIRDGWAVDRIVADPELNALFLAECWRLGAMASPYDLNRALMNARKSGALSRLNTTKRYSLKRDRQDQFAYACELAIRYLQDAELRDYGRLVSVDAVLCDPRLASTFDALAERIAPGFKSLEYRWALLAMRKRGRNASSELGLAQFETLGESRSLALSSLPHTAGLYWMHKEGHELYVGQASDLSGHFEAMFDLYGSSLVPQWLVENRRKSVQLAIKELPDTSSSGRNSLIGQLVNTVHPSLNYRGPQKAA